MKVIEPCKFITSLIRCPHCEALLEIDKRDVDYIGISMSLDVLCSVICPVCYDGIPLKITDNGEFKLLKED